MALLGRSASDAGRSAQRRIADAWHRRSVWRRIAYAAGFAGFNGFVRGVGYLVRFAGPPASTHAVIFSSYPRRIVRYGEHRRREHLAIPLKAYPAVPGFAGIG